MASSRELLLLAALDRGEAGEFQVPQTFWVKLCGGTQVLSHRMPLEVTTYVEEPAAMAAPRNADRRFAALVEEHAPMVFRTLTRLLGTRDGVDDLAQDCFLRLYRALPAFRGEALVSTYLYRIVVNVAQDELRRWHREERPLRSLADEAEGWGDRLRHPGRNAEELLLEREFAACVERALTQLSSIQRAVLVLYHQEERTYEQIAVVLGMPIGTVRTHLHRARGRLRALIGAGRQSESNDRRARA